MSNPKEIEKILQRDLTKNQHDVVLDKSENILCLACAGSGKSRTLAYRIAYLLSEGNAPESIVAFTFTEKAAESIKRRVSEALSALSMDETLVGAMYIGTIHSYCQHLLGRIDADYRQYDVLDENRLKLYLLSRYGKLGLKEIKNSRNSKMFNTIKEVSDAWKTANDEGISFEEIVKSDSDIGVILERIDESLRTDKFIDFSMMIRMAVEMLENNREGTEEALAPLKHLLVDEYQDINPMQERLIKELRCRAESLVVVGDDDQSIYSWRGADVNNILTFQKRYESCSVHYLSTNFRSTKLIVHCSDEFIKQELSAARHSKNPESHSDGNISDFRSLWFDERSDEGVWISEKIKSLLGAKYIECDGNGNIKEERGLDYSDFAILFRSMKSDYEDSPRHFEVTRELKNAEIPYSLASEGSIFERPYACAIRELLELLRNPHPRRRDVESVFDRIISLNFPKADFNLLTKVISDWNTKIHGEMTGRRKLYPQELLHQLYEACGVNNMDFNEAVLRDLGAFSGIILDVEKVYISIDSAYRYTDMLNFLSNVAESGYDLNTLDLVARPNAVTISTIHKMKGLEFPVVFIADVIQGRFPKNKRKYSGWLPSNLMAGPISRGAYCTDRKDEARLFYTAMTRAERFLYITGSAKHPNLKNMKKKSDFKICIDKMGVELNDGMPYGMETVERKPRIDENILPTSYSEIKEYMHCPMGYKLKKLFGFNPSVPELFGFGLSTHTVIERLHQTYDRPPNESEIDKTVDETFHLKHLFSSKDPLNNPGPYENARARARSIVKDYVSNFSEDFERLREDEARFEISVGQAVVSGSIDLLLKKDETGKIIDASVIDFKAMDNPDEESDDWIDMSLQVQLYVHAAENVFKEFAKTGYVHFLKNLGKDARVGIPVNVESISTALSNITWAVNRILDMDFPMRPHKNKCNICDVRRICIKKMQNFKCEEFPEPLHLPNNKKLMIKAIGQCD